MYVADSDARCVRAFDLDHDGAASNQRVVIDKIAGVPDGIRTDEKGNLYVAAKAVFVYSPQAQLLGQITLAETPSNLAFGDADLETLFITARTVRVSRAHRSERSFAKLAAGIRNIRCSAWAR